MKIFSIFILELFASFNGGLKVVDTSFNYIRINRYRYFRLFIE